jgi:ribosomal-protein-alanine N-acetyltransferase
MAGPEPAAPAHAAAMAAIHRAALPWGETWDADAFAAQLALPGVAGWIDPAGGMILVRIAADEMEVLTLAVVPNARRRGIGAALLDTAMAWARSLGTQTAFLEVAVGNVAARALYEQAGFVPAGRRPRYYADGTDALILRRPLNAPGAVAAR